MIGRQAFSSSRHIAQRSGGRASICRATRSCTTLRQHNYKPQTSSRRQLPRSLTGRSFHSSQSTYAQPPTADALMENLTDLYATAKDEFEIAAEETEKKTVYAADDREAAKEALATLKEAYEKALKESAPDVANEVQTRTGPRIKELENALTAVEEMAMED